MPFAYDDSMWEPGPNPRVSPCCQARIYAWSCDGIATGSCESCHENVVRINRKTKQVERPIDGAVLTQGRGAHYRKDEYVGD